MTKIALINTTNSISKLWTTPSNEVFGIKQMLIDLDYDVDIISKKEDKNLGILSVDNVSTLNNYDKILIIPGTFAFYHNDPKGFIFKIYSLLAKVQQKIYVLSTDVTVPLKQLYQQASRFMDISKDDINITAPIVFISLTKEQKVIDRLINKDEFNIDKIIPFNFDIFAAYTNIKNDNYWLKITDVKTKYDVIYGGAWRGGRRSEAFYNYLCDIPFTTAVYGTIRQKQLDKLNDKYNVTTFPENLSKVPGNKVVRETSKGLVTFIPGEKNMTQMTTARVWESMLSKAVTFIDESYDPAHSISSNDFIYLHEDKQEFIDKVKEVKYNPEFRASLLNAQHNLVVKLGFSAWLRKFKEIIEN